MDQSPHIVRNLSCFAVAMFAFGYLLVPLYDVFCDLTGLNGKTGVISVVQAENKTVDNNRSVTVQFDTNVNPDLPWRFDANTFEIKVLPGVINEVRYTIENYSDQIIIGKAVPSVAPNQASLYFDKTECFCFDQQQLKAGEITEVVVRFVVDKALPIEISTLTLSYTFYRLKDGIKT